MRRNTERRIAAGFCAALVALATARLLAHYNAGRLTHSDREVARAQGALATLHSTFSVLQDAETGQRGYVITSSDRYLEPYQRATRSVDEQFRLLWSLLGEDPTRASTLADVQRLTREKFKEMDETIRLRRTKGFAAAAAAIAADRGADLMDAIRRRFAQLEAEERGVIRAQEAEAAAAERRVAVLSVEVTALEMVLFLVAYYVISRYVDRRDRAAAALRQSEERFRLLVDGVKDYALILLDADGRVASWNGAAERTGGYRADEIVGRDRACFYAPDDVEAGRPRRALDAALRDGSCAEEGWRVRKDGSRFWADVLVTVLRNDDGSVRGFAQLTRDITDRRNAELFRTGQSRVLELLATGEPLRDVLAALVEAIEQQCLDVVGSVLLLDEEGKRLRHGAAPNLPLEFTCAIDGVQIGPNVGSCGTAAYLRTPVISHDIATDPRWAPVRGLALASNLHSCWSHPIFSKGQRVLGTFALYSHHCRTPEPAEVRLIASAAHLAGIAIERHRAEVELLRAKDQAETANRAKDQFLAVLSHELRNPLTPILIAASMMEQDPTLPAHVAEDAAAIRRNVELEARLIDDLLDVTGITRGKLHLKEAVVDVHDLLRQTFDMCEGEIVAKEIALRAEFRAEERHVAADPARLQQVFWNVLKNAVKFTPTGGRIYVRTATTAGRALRIEVSDDGIGIAPAKLATIFDAFEQGEPGISRQFGGLGLGLAISRSLVEMQRGRITAASPGPGCGATFTITFPVVPAPAAHAPPPPTPLEEGGRRSLRILVVEDHASTAYAIAKLLRRSGHLVDCVGTVAAAAAAAAASHGKFDLLVCDIGLPDGSGLDLMRQLKAAYGLRGIALTGHGGEEDVRRSIEAGFDEHVSKPICMQDLETTILRVAAAPTSPDANPAAAAAAAAAGPLPPDRAAMALTATPAAAAVMPRVLIVDDCPGITQSVVRLLGGAGYDTVVFHDAAGALAYVRANAPVDAAVVDVHLPDMNGLQLSEALRARLGPALPIIVLSGDATMDVVNALPRSGATYYFNKPVRSSQLLYRLDQLLARR